MERNNPEKLTVSNRYQISGRIRKRQMADT